uniref:Replication protein n=1 Tax=Thermus sp. (strain YS45) TaxID=64227 RepID=O34089_THESY|nr:replication protein [Thermus sp. YS45]AAC46045.1 replication protein [Thermus sp. YS45]
MKNEKTFFEELYEALEETHDNTDATRGSDRGSEDFFLATDPPPDGGAENRLAKGFTYQKEALRIALPEKDHEAFLSSVGAPPIPPAEPPVGNVCQAVQDGPQKLLELLQEIARSTIPYGNRELWRKVGTVVFMVPLEMLALNLGVTRQTVHAWKKVLEKKGLVATDVLHQTVNGERRAIGTLWAVRLRPGKARLTLDDYIYPWRNLALDMANGVLSFNWVKAYQDHGIRPTLDVLVLWAQGKRVMPNTKTVAVDLGLILVLPEVERSKLPALITLIATYIADLLDDRRSRRFYAGLLWAVARGELPAQYLFAVLMRVIRDYTDGHLTRPGAYLVKTLKEAS